MATIEDYENGGILYEHKIFKKHNKFTRKDDRNCYINYEINNTTPISIYIDTWVCFTEPAGSGRILMKALFEFIKNKYDGVNDNTVVSLIPMPNLDKNPRIPAEKRTLPNLVAYYKSINFDKEYFKEGSNYLSGTIGNIIRGISDYIKIGGRRKTKRTNKLKRSNKLKKKNKSTRKMYY
jgi:hypothetical protein